MPFHILNQLLILLGVTMGLLDKYLKDKPKKSQDNPILERFIERELNSDY
jgi:hypothetical protein